MAQAARDLQDDWSPRENEQCRHIINKIFNYFFKGNIRQKELDKLILELTKRNLLDKSKFRYEEERKCNIKFKELIIDGAIDRDLWKTRDTLMFWIKDIKRSFI
jgi:hypothetical protein